MRPVLSVKAPRERRPEDATPRAVIAVLALIVVWGLGSGWWYTCRIQAACTSALVVEEPLAETGTEPMAPPADLAPEHELPNTEAAAPASAATAVPALPGPATTSTATGATPEASAIAATSPEVAATQPTSLTAYFGRKSTEIVVPPESEAALPALLAAVKQGAAIKIVGHSDARGAPALKAELSAQRAIILRDWLIAHGVAAEAITTLESQEDREPVADNSTSAGRAKNRRAVATIIPQGE